MQVPRHPLAIYPRTTNWPRLRLTHAAQTDTGFATFILVAGNLRGTEIAAVFVAALPAIYRILRLQQGPFVGRIAKSGKVAVGPR